MDKVKCLICEQESSPKSFHSHLKHKHNMTTKEYYDKFLKTEGDGICLTCGTETKFLGILRGYRKFCPNKACINQNKAVRDKIKQTCLDRYGEETNLKTKDTIEKRKSAMVEKFGVEYGFQSDSIREKAEQSVIDKYGVDNPFKSDEVRNKIKQTCLDRYGVDHNFKIKEVRKQIEQTNIDRYGAPIPIQSDVIKDKIEQTNLEKYGVKYPLLSDDIQRKIKESNIEKFGVERPLQSAQIREKINKTFNEKYGTNSSLGSGEVQEKIKQTNLERYGVENVLQNPEIREKAKQTMLEMYGVDNIGKLQSVQENNNRILQKKIADFEKETNSILLNKLIQIYGQGWYHVLDFPKYTLNNLVFIPNDYIKTIKEYTQRGRSIFESEIASFVDDLYNGKVDRNTRKVITPYELDVYIPDKKLAIECNGLYYHSTNHGVSKYYHLMKTEKCAEQGVRLIHINEWEWYNRKEICKSIIAGALGVFDERIFARKCSIQEVNLDNSKDFLEKNHIQGYVPSSYRLGLFYKDELVQIVTIGKSRFKEGEWELLRMCTKLNTQVIGGFSKLLHHIPKEYKEIISFVDKGKFTGKGYYSAGWEYISDSAPNYHYFLGAKRYTRNQCQKHKLKSFLGEENFDPELTEMQNMLNNGFLQLFDCGNIKVKYKIK